MSVARRGELLRRAVTDSAEAIDALVTSAGGQSRPAASVGVTMDHINADMRDEVKEQRQKVHGRGYDAEM